MAGQARGDGGAAKQFTLPYLEVHHVLRPWPAHFRSGRLLDWARRAEAAGFHTLGLLDRLVFKNPEPLIALATLAGATSRIRLQTEVLLGPLRDTALLAKQAATLDRMSGGRFVLGLGVGGREDDHLCTGYDIRTRGRRLDEQLAVMHRIWAGSPFDDKVGPIGPAPHRTGGPEVVFGGFKPAAIARVGRWGDGFLAAAPPSWAGPLFENARQAWTDAGRLGAPRIIAQVNVALGSQAVIDDARAEMGGYYEFTGMSDRMVSGMLITPGQIRETVEQFDELGADEVMFYCYGSDPEQVTRIADAIA